MSADLTVIIPTHNPKVALLGRVLSHLRDQTLPADRWQVILVDNASTPAVNEADCRRWVDKSVVVREDRPGLLYARVAGIRPVATDLIVFVDDDNLLARDYLANAVAFMRGHPRVGIAGGRIVGEFLQPPQKWAEPHLGSLALRDLGDAELFSEHRQNCGKYDYFAPLGAGMVIRTHICRDFVDRVDAGGTPSIGRSGTHLGGCEDCDLVIQNWATGLECAYVPSLVLTHVIPNARLAWSYLQRLAFEGQQSWGQFLVRHQFAAPVAPWTVPVRQAKAFIAHRAWTRSGFIRWRGACGFITGRAAASRECT